MSLDAEHERAVSIMAKLEHYSAPNGLHRVPGHRMCGRAGNLYPALCLSASIRGDESITKGSAVIEAC